MIYTSLTWPLLDCGGCEPSTEARGLCPAPPSHREACAAFHMQGANGEQVAERDGLRSTHRSARGTRPVHCPTQPSRHSQSTCALWASQGEASGEPSHPGEPLSDKIRRQEAGETRRGMGFRVQTNRHGGWSLCALTSRAQHTLQGDSLNECEGRKWAARQD